jgi:hypothetical protein
MPDETDPVKETLPKAPRPGGKFRPGQAPGPGRPKGIPNKIAWKQREVAALILGEPGSKAFQEFVAHEREEWKAGTMHPGVKVLWLHYLLGKPTETIDVHGEITSMKIVRMTLDEQTLSRETMPAELQSELLQLQ